MCLEFLLIHVENELFVESIVKNFLPSFVAIIDGNNLNQVVISESIPFLSQCIENNLISQTEAKPIAFLFLKMLNKREDFEKSFESILYLLGLLVKKNFISTAEAEKFLLPLKKALLDNSRQFWIQFWKKISTLLVFTHLINADLITAKRMIILLSDYKFQDIEEEEDFAFGFARLYMQNVSDFLELMPLVIILIYNSKQGANIVRFCFEKLFQHKSISLTIIKQLFSFVIAFVETKGIKFNESPSLCFKDLVERQFIEAEDILTSILKHPNNEVQEIGLLCLQCFAQYNLLSPQIIKKQLFCVLKTMVNADRTLCTALFNFLEDSSIKQFIDRDIVEMQLMPWALKILSDSTLNEKKHGLLLLHSFAIRNLISKESLEKLIPVLKLMLKINEAGVYEIRNLLLFISAIIKDNKNYIEQAVSILHGFELEEQEALQFLNLLEDKDETPISMVVELRHLLFLIIGANGGSFVRNKIEKLLYNNEVSFLAYEGNGREVFQTQYLLFLRELIGQGIVKNYQYTFELFYRLFIVRDAFMKIILPMFADTRPVVKEYVCLLVDYFTNMGLQSIVAVPSLIATIAHPDQQVQKAALRSLKSIITKNELLSEEIVEEQLPLVISMIEDSESQIQQGWVSCLSSLSEFFSAPQAEKVSHVILSKFNNFQLAQQNDALTLLTAFIRKKLISSQIALEKLLYVVQMIGSTKGNERYIAYNFLSALIETKYLSAQLVKTQLLPVVETILKAKKLDVKMTSLMTLQMLIEANLIAKVEVGNLILAIAKSFYGRFLDSWETGRIISCLTTLVSYVDAESISSLHEEALCSLIVTMLDKQKGTDFDYSFRKLLDVLTNRKLFPEQSINNLRKLDLDFYKREKKADFNPELNPADSIIASNIEIEQEGVNYINPNIVFKYIVYLLFFAGIYHSMNYTWNPDR